MKIVIVSWLLIFAVAVEFAVLGKIQWNTALMIVWLPFLFGITAVVAISTAIAILLGILNVSILFI